MKAIREYIKKKKTGVVAILFLWIVLFCAIYTIIVGLDVENQKSLLYMVLSNPYISGIIYTISLLYIVYAFQIYVSKSRIKLDFCCSEVMMDITLPEESSFYISIGHPIPAVCIRTSTERPEALDKGCFVLSGIDTEGLLQSVDLAVEMVKNGDNGIPVPDYVDTNVSDKVVRIIQSYVGVVNKMVWRK